MRRFLPALLFVVTSAYADGSLFYRGVDLSYVNEMEDNGGVYREAGAPVDPFVLFAQRGANLVRARLWVDATWTKYSNLADVTKTFRRARAQGMDLLLDLHYSDTWADPGHQKIPARWKDLTDAQLVQAVYDYTRDTLKALADQGVLPQLVQIGNETNGGLIKRGNADIEWDRDVALLNSGIRAAHDLAASLGVTIRTVVHIAQPQNGAWFFRNATAHGLQGFDIIGLSYYPQWSPLGVEATGVEVEALSREFRVPVLIVETGAPWTLARAPETMGNVLTQGIPGYRINPQGQKAFLVDLARALAAHGGAGLVYWEPGWISTKARTLWGQGSGWENATFFDFENGNEVLPAIDFLSVSSK